MTRRGSFVYYLVAVVCGSFFLAAAYQGHSVATAAAGPRWLRDFFFLYFVAIPLGLIPMVVSAWLLRRAMGGLGWRRGWQWLLAGTLLMTGVLLGLGYVGLAIERARFPAEYQRLKSGVMALLLAPTLFTFRPVWLAMLGVAPTAWLLYLVHRAFEPREEAPASLDTRV
jgi:hypothetical protein